MDQVRSVPANQASWEDLQAIFMTNSEGRGCACQWFKQRDKDWKPISADARMADLREQTGCGNDDAEQTSGLVAYVGDEPAGWVAVEPRVNHQRLLRMRTPWVGRDEDKRDDGVWVVSWFLIRKEVIWRELYVGPATAFGAAGFPLVATPSKRRRMVRIEF